MNDYAIKDIVIRHLTGSKANLVEHVELAGVTDITIGRDPASKIAFDSKSDDVVSRRHAIIRVIGGTQISFRLSDIGSNNGTYLNGRQVAEPVELLPEDVIELGKGGPKFVFDVQPRPPYLVARTRVIDLTDANATRVVKSAEMANEAAQDAASKSGERAAPKGGDRPEPPPPPAAPPKFGPPSRPDVSRETVRRWIDEERGERERKSEAASRVWTKERETSKRNLVLSVFALAAVVALGGGWFYWKHVRDQNLARLELLKTKEDLARRETGLENKIAEETAARVKREEELRQQQEEEQQKAAEEQKKIAEAQKSAAGMGAQEIASTYGNATAQVNMAWRLYDQTTGRPIFHQMMEEYVPTDNGKKELKKLPAYVRLPGGQIIRWLTLEDDHRRNIPIGGEGSGTGFAVSENGFMLTNKHLAAAWELRFGADDPAYTEYKQGFLYEYYIPGPSKKAKKSKLKLVEVINLQNLFKHKDLYDWAPARGGIIFSPDVPTVIGEFNIPDSSKIESDAHRTFFGRNDSLNVQFANSRGLINAALVNFSNYSDAALIKVDTPQQLKKLDIASDDAVTVGETVIVVGFPDVSVPTLAVSQTIENRQRREIKDIVPQPYVTEGNVAVISPAVKTKNDVTIGGSIGDLIQMSINATGPGNSGGPVFNKWGKVIGLFTYSMGSGDVRTTLAVPIKYGRDLLESQAH